MANPESYARLKETNSLPSSPQHGSSPVKQQQLSPNSPYPSSNPSMPALPKLGQPLAPLPPGEIMQITSTLDTLDEPVLVTLKRDLLNIWRKLKVVLLPGSKDSSTILRDWDLWGPLLLCLTMAICLGMTAPPTQSAYVFTLVFVVIWAGSFFVTVNAKLLGGHISFFQSVCVLGYCVFPLTLAEIACLFVPIIWIRGIFVSAAFLWSTIASIGFLNVSGLQNRRTLAVYPVFLFYFIISWVILVSHSLIGN